METDAILSCSLVHTSARLQEDEYAIPYSTILRLDKEVLENDIPKQKLKDVQGVLIDEKFLGTSQGSVTDCLNAATGEPLEIVSGKDSHCLDDFFNRFDEQQKRKIKYLGIDRSNAYKSTAIKRIQAKACGLFDVRYLFLKLRQVHFLRLQRMHKTSRTFYQQI